MRELRRILRPLLADGWSVVALLLFLVTLSQALLLLPPVIIGRAIDLFANGAHADVWGWLGVLVVVVLARALITPFQARSLTRVIQETTFRFSVDCTRTIFAKDFDFFRDANVGGVLKRSERGIEGFEGFASFLLIVALPAIVTTVLVAATLATIAGWAILLALTAAAAAFVSVSVFVIRWRRPYLDDVNDAEDDLAETYAETYLAAPSLKAAGRSDAASGGLRAVYRAYADRATNLSFATAVLGASQDLISTLAIAASIGIGVLIVTASPGSVTAGDFVVIFSYVGLFMASVRDLIDVRKKHDEFRADISELDALLARPAFREGLPDADLSQGDIVVRPFALSCGPSLRIEDELRLPRGSRVAVVGETGSGKTSFLEAIAGLTSPPGTVLIGGHDVTEVSYRSVTDALLYSPQAPRFLSGPFGRAVLFDAPGSSNLDRIRVLLRRLRLGVLAGLLDADDMPVARLSGGERRRLAALRALFDPHPILVLDEPTGDLDAEVASEVWAAILEASKGSTLICATHDLSKLPVFDRVLLVANGLVTEIDAAAAVGRVTSETEA